MNISTNELTNLKQAITTGKWQVTGDQIKSGALSEQQAQQIQKLVNSTFNTQSTVSRDGDSYLVSIPRSAITPQDKQSFDQEAFTKALTSKLSTIHEEPKDSEGKTALFKAVEAGNYSLTEKLIKQGCNVNAKDLKGDYPLSVALRYFSGGEKVNITGRQWSLIKLLIEAGADPYLVDSQGKNAFSKVISLQDITLCKLLGEKHTFSLTVNELDYLAYASGDFPNEFFTLFPKIAFTKKSTFLEKLIERNNLKLLKSIQQNAPHAFKKAVKEKFLLENAVTDPVNYELVQFLIEQGADLSSAIPDILKFTDDTKTLEFLLDHGLSINWQDQKGKTLLHHLVALGSKKTRLYEFCLQKGIDVLLKDSSGKTAAQLAIDLNDHIAWHCIRQSPQGKNLDFEGKTPLHKAIENKNFEAFKQLYESEGVIIPFQKGPTSLLNYAAEFGQVEIFAYLRDKGLRENGYKVESSHILTALRFNQVDLIQWLLKNVPKYSYQVNDVLLGRIENIPKDYYYDCLESVWHDTDILREHYGNLEVVKKYFATEPSYSYFSKSEKLTEIFIQSLQDHSDIAQYLLDKISYLTYKKIEEQYPLNLLVQKASPALLKQALTKFGDHDSFTYPTWPIELCLADQVKLRLLWPYYIKAWAKGRFYTEADFGRLLSVAIESGCEDLLDELLQHEAFSKVLNKHCIKTPKVVGEISPLYLAILQGNAAIVQKILNKNVPIYENGFWFNMLFPVDAALYFAFLSRNQKVIQLIAAEIEQLGKEPDFKDILLHFIAEAHPKYIDKEVITDFFMFVLKRYAPLFTETQYQELADVLSTMNSEVELYAIFKYMTHHAHTFEEWKLQLGEIQEFASNVKRFCTVNLGNLSLSQTHNWIMTQLIEHIFQGMNPKLASEKNVWNNVIGLLQQVTKNEHYGLIFTALQVTSNTDIALKAVKSALKHDSEESLLRSLLRVPDAALSEGQLNDIKERLAYYCVYRRRKGISDCLVIIKTWRDHPILLPLALDTLITVGIDLPNKELRSRFSHYLKEMIQESTHPETAVKALKALCATESRSSPEMLQYLLEQLKGSPEYLCEVLEELSGCELSSEKDAQMVMDKLSSLLNHPSEAVRYQLALTLSGIPNTDGLFKALEIVKSPVWEKQDKNYGLNNLNHIGNFLMFRSRPDHLHDNRKAVIERILDRLVALEKGKPGFEQEIEAAYYNYKQKPEAFQGIKAVHDKIKEVNLDHARYFAVPLFYPKGTDLIRGLSTRKGDASFKESIRDLFRKGAGSCELTEGDAEITGGTWKKIGHVFATHAEGLFFSEEKGSTYFSADENGVVKNSAIVIIPSEFYHEEAMKGQARIEKEGSYNNVFYRGVPKHWIKALYLSEENKGDISLIHGSELIEDVAKKLTTDLFADCSRSELKEFRRYLQSKQVVQGKEISLFERLHFFGKNNATEIGQQVKTQAMFVDEGQVIEESLKWAIGRDLIVKKYAPQMFWDQTDLLKLDDVQFEKYWPQLQKMLPASLKTAKMPGPMQMDEPALEKERVMKRISCLYDSLPWKDENERNAFVKDTLQARWRYFGISQQDIDKIK